MRNSRSTMQTVKFARLVFLRAVGSVLLLLAALPAAAQTRLKTDILWRAGGSVGIDRISPDGNEFTSWDNGPSTVWTRSGRQRMTLTESQGFPVSFSPNRQDLVGVVGLSTGSAIGIWSRATGELNRIIPLQGFGVSELVLSPDGAYLAALGSSSSQTRVRLIEYATGLLVTNVEAVVSYGLKPVFSPNGQFVAVNGSSNVSLVSTTDGTLQRAFPSSGYAPKFSPDGRRLAYYVYTGTQNQLQVFSVADGSLERALPATNSADFAFLADNNLLVVSEGSLVRVWSLADGQVVRTFTGHDDDPAISINSVYASPKDDRVVSIDSYRRRRAILWSATTGSILTTIDLSEGYGSAQFTPNGEEFAIARISAGVSGGDIEFSQFWRTSDGSLAAEIQPAHRGWVHALGFSPDSRHVATGAAGGSQGDINYQQQHFVLWGYDTRVQVWRVADGVKEAELLGAASAVTAVAISSVGVVAGGAGDGTLHFWRLATGEHLNEVNIGSGIIWSLAFSPDGSQIAVVTEGGTVSVCSVPDGSEVALLEASGDGFTSVAWSPDGQYVAGGAYHGTPTEVDTRLWSATDGSLIRTFFGAAGSLPGITSDSPGCDLHFSPAGDRLLIGSWCGEMRLVNVTNGTFARLWSDSTCRFSPGFAADGIHILASNPDYSGTTKFGAYAYGALEWYSTTNTSRLYRHVAECNRISVAAVSPNGLYYAVGREDGTLFLARSPVYPWTLQLTPAVSGGGLTLGWSADLASLVLQSATTLAHGGDWQDSSLTPTVVGNQNMVTVKATNSAGFFRLRNP